MNMDISVLIGMVVTDIQGGVGDSEIVFTTNQGRKFKLYHGQDCCEVVTVEEIVGDLQSIIGSPIRLAESVSSEVAPPGAECPDAVCEWTFYKLATLNGYVTIRWMGSSNGYYSTSVFFEEITD